MYRIANLEINLPALAVSDAPFVQDLQQYHCDILKGDQKADGESREWILTLCAFSSSSRRITAALENVNTCANCERRHILRTIRFSTNSLGQLTALFKSDVARSSANQAGDGVPIMILNRNSFRKRVEGKSNPG